VPKSIIGSAPSKHKTRQFSFTSLPGHLGRDAPRTVRGMTPTRDCILSPTRDCILTGVRVHHGACPDLESLLRQHDRAHLFQSLSFYDSAIQDYRVQGFVVLEL
jgi:hypothetical protein